MSDTRIVLVKPGDVLMLGNVTLPEDAAGMDAFDTAIRMLKETLGLAHVLVFEGDVALAVEPAEIHHEVHVQQAWSPERDALAAAAARQQQAMSRVGRFT